MSYRECNKVIACIGIALNITFKITCQVGWLWPAVQFLTMGKLKVLKTITRSSKLNHSSNKLRFYPANVLVHKGIHSHMYDLTVSGAGSSSAPCESKEITGLDTLPVATRVGPIGRWWGTWVASHWTISCIGPDRVTGGEST
jgi:hypothetical protein